MGTHADRLVSYGLHQLHAGMVCGECRFVAIDGGLTVTHPTCVVVPHLARNGWSAASGP